MSIPPSSSKPTPEQIATLWRKGNLNFKLRNEQKQFKKAFESTDKRLIVGNISRRWGKSFTLVLFAIEQAIKAKQHIRYAAAFKTDLEEFIIPAFEQILEDCPKNLRPTYLASKQTWIFKNGSKIKLIGLDKARNGLRGNAINIIILDEAAFVSSLQYQYESVIIPATAKQKNIKIVIISTPPESPEHYFLTLIEQAKSYPYGYYLCLTIDDISDMPPEERERLLEAIGGEQSITAQREFFCKLVVDENQAVAPNFRRSRHVSELSLADDAYYWVAGDIGGTKDKSVLLLCAYDYATNKIYIANESVSNNNTPTPVIVKRGIEMENGRMLARYVDAPGQLGVDLMSVYDYSCSTPEKLQFEQNMHRLSSAFYKNEILIDPKCEFLIRTLEGGLLNKSKTDFARSPGLGHCDAIAALVYALRHADKRPPYRPRARNQDIHNMAPTVHDTLINELKKLF
jgi:hypothetical protein